MKKWINFLACFFWFVSISQFSYAGPPTNGHLTKSTHEELVAQAVEALHLEDLIAYSTVVISVLAPKEFPILELPTTRPISELKDKMPTLKLTEGSLERLRSLLVLALPIVKKDELNRIYARYISDTFTDDELHSLLSFYKQESVILFRDFFLVGCVNILTNSRVIESAISDDELRGLFLGLESAHTDKFYETVNSITFKMMDDFKLEYGAKLSRIFNWLFKSSMFETLTSIFKTSKEEAAEEIQAYLMSSVYQKLKSVTEKVNREVDASLFLNFDGSDKSVEELAASLLK